MSSPDLAYNCQPLMPLKRQQVTKDRFCCAFCFIPAETNMKASTLFTHFHHFTTSLALWILPPSEAGGNWNFPNWRSWCSAGSMPEHVGSVDRCYFSLCVRIVCVKLPMKKYNLTCRYAILPFLSKAKQRHSNMNTYFEKVGGYAIYL